MLKKEMLRIIIGAICVVLLGAALGVCLVKCSTPKESCEITEVVDGSNP